MSSDIEMVQRIVKLEQQLAEARAVLEQKDIDIDGLMRKSNTRTQQLAESQANEATCHCGRLLSEHRFEEHTAIEMPHPCPFAQQLAEARALWSTAVNAEGTDWADDIMEAVREEGGGHV
jgi:hypothetical protein